MKALIALVVSFFIASGVVAKDAARYSGHAQVEGLGEVAFPAGEWELEYSRVQQDPARDKQQREYFVFKRTGVAGERLTILRYNPVIAPRTIPYPRRDPTFWLGNGLPMEVEKPTGAAIR